MATPLDDLFGRVHASGLPFGDPSGDRPRGRTGGTGR